MHYLTIKHYSLIQKNNKLKFQANNQKMQQIVPQESTSLADSNQLKQEQLQSAFYNEEMNQISLELTMDGNHAFRKGSSGQQQIHIDDVDQSMGEEAEPKRPVFRNGEGRASRGHSPYTEVTGSDRIQQDQRRPSTTSEASSISRKALHAAKYKFAFRKHSNNARRIKNGRPHTQQLSGGLVVNLQQRQMINALRQSRDNLQKVSHTMVSYDKNQNGKKYRRMNYLQQQNSQEQHKRLPLERNNDLIQYHGQSLSISHVPVLDGGKSNQRNCVQQTESRISSARQSVNPSAVIRQLSQEYLVKDKSFASRGQDGGSSLDRFKISNTSLKAHIQARDTIDSQAQELALDRARIYKMQKMVMESRNLTKHMISSKKFQKSKKHLHAQITKDHFKQVKEIIMGRRGSSQGEFAQEHSFEEKYVKPIAQSCIDANKIKLKKPTSRKSSKEQHNRQFSLHSRESLNSRDGIGRGSLSSSQMKMMNGQVRRTFHVSSSRPNKLNTLQNDNDHTFKNQFSMFDEVVETLGRPDSRVSSFTRQKPDKTIRKITSNRSHSIIDTHTPSIGGRKDSETAPTAEKDDQTLTMPNIAKQTPVSSQKMHRAVTTMKAITRPIFQPQRNSHRPDHHPPIKDFKAGVEAKSEAGGMSAFRIKLAQTKSRKIPTLLSKIDIDQSNNIDVSGNTQSLSVEKQNPAELQNKYINQIGLKQFAQQQSVQLKSIDDLIVMRGAELQSMDPIQEQKLESTNANPLFNADNSTSAPRGLRLRQPKELVMRKSFNNMRQHNKSMSNFYVRSNRQDAAKQELMNRSKSPNGGNNSLEAQVQREETNLKLSQINRVITSHMNRKHLNEEKRRLKAIVHPAGSQKKQSYNAHQAINHSITNLASVMNSGNVLLAAQPSQTSGKLQPPLKNNKTQRDRIRFISTKFV